MYHSSKLNFEIISIDKRILNEIFLMHKVDYKSAHLDKHSTFSIACVHYNISLI